MKLYDKFKKMPDILQFIMNICLGIIALALSMLLIIETWSIISLAFSLANNVDTHFELAGELLLFFLYFEFIALIVKYFKSNYHFPLQYFFYIGITAIIRLIIIDHDEAISTFWWSMAIIVMICSLYIANTRAIRKD